MVYDSLSDKQYGFHFANSTANMITEFFNQALDMNVEALAVPLDTSKDFDMVWH